MRPGTPGDVVGVWRARADRFVRAPDMEGDWVRWADVPGFARTPTSARVLWFGESSARGLHLDPGYTPASLVQAAATAAARAPVEVLDLARSGATVGRLRRVVDQAARLAPDVVVVCAGNNWRYEASLRGAGTGPDGAAEAQALRRAGVAGVLAVRQERLSAIARATVTAVVEAFAGSGARLLFVLPESNLVDWHPPVLAPALARGVRAWHAAMAELRAAAERGDRAAVDALVDEVAAIDGGVGDEACRRRARLALAEGDVDAALADFRHARDVRLWYPGIDAPSLPRAAARAAAEAARAGGADVLDLADVLPGHAATGVPDRSLFLDWCHLDAAGIRTAGAHVAARVLTALGADPPPVEEMAATLPPPAADLEAGSHVCAALENARWGQPPEVVAFHVDRAAALAPSGRATLHAVRELSARRVPVWSWPDSLSPAPNVRRLVEVAAVAWHVAPRGSFVDAVGRLPGANGAEPFPPAEGPVVKDGTELLDPEGAPGVRDVDWEGLAELDDFAFDGAWPHLFRAHHPRSAFPFVLDGPAGDLELHLTVRLISGSGPAAGSRSGLLGVTVGGHNAGQHRVTSEWCTVGCSVPAAALAVGGTAVELAWPPVPDGFPVERAARRLAGGWPPDLAVVHGEVYSIRARVTGEAAGRR